VTDSRRVPHHNRNQGTRRVGRAGLFQGDAVARGVPTHTGRPRGRARPALALGRLAAAGHCGRPVRHALAARL